MAKKKNAVRDTLQKDDTLDQYNIAKDKLHSLRTLKPFDSIAFVAHRIGRTADGEAVIAFGDIRHGAFSLNNLKGIPVAAEATQYYRDLPFEELHLLTTDSYVKARTISTLIATGEITDAAGHIAAEDFRSYPAALDVAYSKGLIGGPLSREKSDDHPVLPSPQQREDGKAIIHKLAQAPGFEGARDLIIVELVARAAALWLLHREDFAPEDFIGHASTFILWFCKEYSKVHTDKKTHHRQIRVNTKDVDPSDVIKHFDNTGMQLAGVDLSDAEIRHASKICYISTYNLTTTPLEPTDVLVDDLVPPGVRPHAFSHPMAHPTIPPSYQKTMEKIWGPRYDPEHPRFHVTAWNEGDPFVEVTPANVWVLGRVNQMEKYLSPWRHNLIVHVSIQEAFRVLGETEDSQLHNEAKLKLVVEAAGRLEKLKKHRQLGSKYDESDVRYDKLYAFI